MKFYDYFLFYGVFLNLNQKSEKNYYTQNTWNENSWKDIIFVEYEKLIDTYPFDENLQSIFKKRNLNLLDIGCGTAIFPSYLDKALSNNIHFSCDLLDISNSSLQQAKQVMDKLDHFNVNQMFNISIEDISTTLSGNKKFYDVILAIHSFTTVDIKKMKNVYKHIYELLAPNGRIFVYQFTNNSSYPYIYNYYLSNHPHGKKKTRFMSYEDTKEILESMGVVYEVYELFFNHEIKSDRYDLLENYLRKCILDNSVDVLTFFKPILKKFHDKKSNKFKIPQFVNFIEIKKETAR